MKDGIIPDHALWSTGITLKYDKNEAIHREGWIACASFISGKGKNSVNGKIHTNVQEEVMEAIRQIMVMAKRLGIVFYGQSPSGIVPYDYKTYFGRSKFMRIPRRSDLVYVPKGYRQDTFWEESKLKCDHFNPVSRQPHIYFIDDTIPPLPPFFEGKNIVDLIVHIAESIGFASTYNYDEADDLEAKLVSKLDESGIKLIQELFWNDEGES